MANTGTIFDRIDSDMKSGCTSPTYATHFDISAENAQLRSTLSALKLPARTLENLKTASGETYLSLILFSVGVPLGSPP